MNKEEQIQEIAKEMCHYVDNRGVDEVCVFSSSVATGGFLKYTNNAGIAEALYDKGYHKTIWHKVADGDLPKKTSLYLCKMVYKENYAYEYKVLLFNTIYGFYDSGLSIVKDAVIAWTELPEYKENEND